MISASCYGNWLIELKKCLLLGWLLGRYHDNHLKSWARLSCTIVASLVEIGSYICPRAHKMTFAMVVAKHLRNLKIRLR